MADSEPDSAKKANGKRIRKRRDELGLSRPQLADRIKARGGSISDQQIYRWEKEGVNPRSQNAAVLEQCLEVRPGWLQHGEHAVRVSLSHSELLTLLDDLKPSPDDHARLIKHLESREAEQDEVTAKYVIGYLRGLRDGSGPFAAHDAARNARAAEVAEDEGRNAPPPPPAPSPKRKEVK